MKDIIVDNIIANSELDSKIVADLVDEMESSGLAKNIGGDYIFSTDYVAICHIAQNYGDEVADKFIDAIKVENRITALDHGYDYFRKI